VLLDDALRRIAALNAKYPVAPDAAPRFLLLHRPRTWSDTERRWMGWERKRGKLEMLVRLLAARATPAASCRSHRACAWPGRTPYVLTLDSDTGLPPGALRDLVSIAAHPLNAPEVDAQSRRVVAGFGILQPRIVTPFPMQNERSFFHWMFAGQCGLDPYGSGASDIYQDVFGSGSFTGKGLLNVRALHATLDRRLPEGAVLSHDLLEGTVARCAMVSDVVLVEDHPHHAGVAASRVHRWVRGDWQLLPLMWRARRFGIDALGLWKMGDNLRRSLVVPASFALLVLVVFTQAMPLGWALAAVARRWCSGRCSARWPGWCPRAAPSSCATSSTWARSSCCAPWPARPGSSCSSRRRHGCCSTHGFAPRGGWSRAAAPARMDHRRAGAGAVQPAARALPAQGRGQQRWPASRWPWRRTGAPTRWSARCCSCCGRWPRRGLVEQPRRCQRWKTR
jgi:hypothetical protein